MDFVSIVKLHIYQTIAETGITPTAIEVAQAMNQPHTAIIAAFQELAAQRLLVLEPGTKEQIRMAPPFSGIPTMHRVSVGGVDYFANCAWDAFGVAAAMGKDADIVSQCADCGEPLHFHIRDHRPVPQEGVAHFAVPAAKWWQNIIHT